VGSGTNGDERVKVERPWVVALTFLKKAAANPKAGEGRLLFTLMGRGP